MRINMTEQHYPLSKIEEKRKLNIDEVNSLPHRGFIKIFGNVVEHNPLAASAVYANRPFKNFEDVRSKFETFLTELSQDGKVGVILLFPDLACKMVKFCELSAESQRERAFRGIDILTPEEHRKLTKWNGRYMDKFKFPFIQCVRENKKEVILRNLELRYENSIEVEIENNINEVIKICTLRLKDLIVDI